MLHDALVVKSFVSHFFFYERNIKEHVQKHSTIYRAISVPEI